MKSSALLKLLSKRLEGKKILVAGDMILDEFLFGSTDRVSREAPVLILKYDRRTVIPGGAANSVNNIKALGGVPLPVGVVGDDEAGRDLTRVFVEQGIDVSGLMMVKEVPTITKTRIMAGGYHPSRQQLIRIDREHHDPYPKAVRALLIERMGKILTQADGMLFSDYGYGVLSDDIRRAVLIRLKKSGKPSVVDSRYRLGAFQGVSTATPNEVEAAHAVGISLENGRPQASLAVAGRPKNGRASPGAGRESELLKCGQALAKKMNLRKGLVITRGRLGMMVFEPGKKPVALPIVGSDEVADVTGAGDTVSGVVALGLAAGLGLMESAQLANYAASVVVMKRGTATVSQSELLRAIQQDKAASRP